MTTFILPDIEFSSTTEVWLDSVEVYFSKLAPHPTSDGFFFVIIDVKLKFFAIARLVKY